MFTIEKHSTVNKLFRINGPDNFFMLVDYDDVDHEMVDIMANTVVAILNENWSMRELIKQANAMPKTRNSG